MNIEKVTMGMFISERIKTQKVPKKRLYTIIFKQHPKYNIYVVMH